MDDRTGDTARVPLLAVLKDAVGECCLIDVPKEVRGRRPGAPVHPHIERLIATKAEAASRRIQLDRRHADIGEGAVDPFEATCVQQSVELPKIGVHELDLPLPGLEGPRREGQDIRVPVQTHHPFGAGLEQRAGVPARTDRAIDEDPRHATGRAS